MKGCIAMRVMERGGRYKKETDYQIVPRAPMTSFVPPAAGGNVLLETARQKRAHGIR